jgi:hypothetical protein
MNVSHPVLRLPCSKLEAMALVLLRVDTIREEVWAQLEEHLTPRQMALYLTVPLEMGAGRVDRRTD